MSAYSTLRLTRKAAINVICDYIKENMGKEFYQRDDGFQSVIDRLNACNWNVNCLYNDVLEGIVNCALDHRLYNCMIVSDDAENDNEEL